MHSRWDAIPASLKVSHVKTALLKQAEKVPVSEGQVYDWPVNWANDTLAEAKQAYLGVKFSNSQSGHWNATLPVKYSARMNAIKKEQVVKAGAHLAQLLQEIWP